MNRRFTYLEWMQDLEQHEADGGVEAVKDFISRTLKSKDNLHIFGRYMFPHIIRGSFDVPDCHIDLTNEIGRRADGAIIFPRGFAKSTWIKIDCLHDIVYGLEPVILYVGRTLGDAALHFESIKTELENNKMLISVYGDLVPSAKDLGRKWTNRHLETTNGVNLVARGAGKGRGVNIKNQRPTKIILDDVEDDEGVRSIDQCMKLRRWINEVIIPSLDPQRGFVKMIGTVLAKHAEVLKFYRKHGGIFRKAIEKGESIWPNFWTMDMLMAKKKSIGTRAFSREYMNNPVDEESAIVKPEWVMGSMYESIQDREALDIVIMMDPQAGESKTADFYGICVLGSMRGQPHRYVLELLRGRASKLKQAAELIKTFQRYKKKCWIVGVEHVMTQNAVYQNVLAWMHRQIDLAEFGVDDTDRNIPFTKVQPKGKDKVARFEAHESAWERGEIHLHHTMTELADQVVSFPDIEHDDDVDALTYALTWSYKSRTLLKTPKDDKNINRRTSIATVGNLQTTRF